MTIRGWTQIAIFFLVVLALTKPVGAFLARVFNRERTFLDPLLRPVEKVIYELCGIRENEEMHWTRYAWVVVLFSAFSLLFTYLLERIQLFLPLNPQKLANVSPALAFNTAISFTTNTNWQAYAGETTMSYLTQMLGLAFHNFASAALGLAVAIALIRGLTRRESNSIGNFWVDLTRGTLWVLLPISVLSALFLVSQGAIQNFKPYTAVHTVEGGTQLLPQGPLASQEAIKELGTNGGGFFNANSAHPFENPTPATNFLEMFLIFIIPAGLTYTLGKMTGNRAHGWTVFAAMSVLFLAAVATLYWAEARGNPLFNQYGVDQHVSPSQSGGNMEGKEVRFGVADTALFATVTTDTSCGAVNGAFDSLTPLGGMIPLLNIMLGEVVFGGVGAGMFGMLLFVVLGVFIAGLMVGRTPEYLGKKIEAKEVQMAMLALLILGFSILGFSAAGVITSRGLAGITNAGPHGLSQVLYAYVSSTGNNGSAFAGLNANTNYYNLTTGIAMLLGRFFMIVPLLAMAGSLARKKLAPASLGTFPVSGPLFATMLVFTVLLVGALTFLPVLALGPVLEHFLLYAGKVF